MQSTEPTQSTDRTSLNLAVLCHLLGLAGIIVPFGHILGPLVLWLIKKNEYPLVDDQGKESLNFQISVTLYAIIPTLLTFVLIGIPLLFVLGILDIIFIIKAAMAAGNGIAYRYPFNLRLVK
ncbi:MAG TPA: DUF4870 domain-containing protein [Candidatus Baltobacteraceae bacterium]|jgi:hypothetical protein|nr:DUF4870 domain-containing protein [Candidatus Baltobacteraceae bacterium]